MSGNRIEIIPVSDSLTRNIHIPEYQRPYKWRVENISDLLSDIEHAINEKKLYADFKYRIGTLILHRDGDRLQIVDGQQRMISLSILNLFLDPDFDNEILRHKFRDNDSLINIRQNHQCIKDWFSLRPMDDRERVLKAFKDILEVVVIYVDSQSEAFQLFDSQNTRGRALDPHDLLKAYHLREMQGNVYDMQQEVDKWEAKDMAKIRELFSDYLFPIRNWSRGQKTWTFTDKDIDTYKGITQECQYTFAKRTFKAMPCFQIAEPFAAGTDFFEMVDHYLILLGNIEEELTSNPDLADISNYFIGQHFSIGLKHVRKLYKAAVLLYYDRFHMMDIRALRKLFMWAFMLRVESNSLSHSSVNKYAVGDTGINSLPIFSIISQARKHTDIGNLIIDIPKEFDVSNCRDERNGLLKLLNKMKQ